MSKYTFDEKGFIHCNELKWGINDVKRILEYNGLEWTEEQMQEVLVRTFRHNDALLEMVDNCIQETIDEIQIEQL
tara:strand:+ start:53 stop:277 length:225 start_codon:yes stop_codon:yes gene_type:complete